MKRISLLIAMAALVLGACTTTKDLANKVIAPSTTVKLNASTDINPDENGRASPTVVKIFELNADSIFQNSDFFNLYEAPEKTLGPDLQRHEELNFLPGEHKQYTQRLSLGTRYIGILVAYRNIHESKWRTLIEIDPRGYDTYTVNLERLGIVVIN